MKTLSGYHGLFSLSAHAAQRIRERFGIEHPAEQALWLIEQLGQATRLDCQLGQHYTTAPRILWRCGDVRIVTDGNDVVTCYIEGERDEETAA